MDTKVQKRKRRYSSYLVFVENKKDDIQTCATYERTIEKRYNVFAQRAYQMKMCF